EIAQELKRSKKRKPKPLFLLTASSPSAVVQEPVDEVEQILQRTGGYCFYCTPKKKLALCNWGQFYERGCWHIDHFIPLSKGGRDDFYNLIPACIGCNLAKGSLYPWEFDSRFRVGDTNPANYLYRF